MDHAAGNGNGSSNGHDAYLGTCAKHFNERAVGHCEDCDDVFCETCLVPPVTKRQPVRCVDCALVAAGVRAPGPRRGSMTNVSRAQKRPSNKLF